MTSRRNEIITDSFSKNVGYCSGSYLPDNRGVQGALAVLCGAGSLFVGGVTLAASDVASAFMPAVSNAMPAASNVASGFMSGVSSTMLGVSGVASSDYFAHFFANNLVVSIILLLSLSLSLVDIHIYVMRTRTRERREAFLALAGKAFWRLLCGLAATVKTLFTLK